MSVTDIMKSVHRDVRKQTELSLMREHQDWVKMHCDTSIEPSLSQPMAKFKNMVRGLLPEDKYNMFLSLLRFPLATNEVTAVIFDRLSRIFEGRNPVFNYQFTKTEYADDWEWYRHERLHEPSVWRDKGWNYFRTEPNSIIVVDMPIQREVGDKYPQPYFYWVTCNDIIDYDCDSNGVFKWVLYKNDETKRVYYIDDKSYRSYRYGANKWNDPVDDGKVENFHPLGFCPVKWFIDEPVSLSHPDVKKSPVSSVLSELDWFLFFSTSKKHLDTFGAYPIYSGYEQDCSYETEVKVGDEITFHHCSHGYLVDEDGKPVIGSDGKQVACPVCGGHRIAGPGTYVDVPAPQEGVPDMRNPIQMLSVDKKSLDYNKEEEIRLRQQLISLCVGVDNNMLTDFSASDAQISANYESQGTILIRVKRVFEKAQQFVDETCCLLRYGNLLESITINYGTEFYTLTTEQLRKRYKEAKEAGASESDLAGLRKQIIETEYRNNPTEGQRMLILQDVEPLSGMSTNDAITRWEKGLLDDDEMKVKANFGSLIRRFERENGNIIFFAETKPYYEKINTIKNTLLDYVEEIQPRASDTAGVQPNVGRGGGGAVSTQE